MKSQDYQQVSKMSRSILKQLGNADPTIQQLNLVESLLIKVTVTQDICFSSKLSNREIHCLYWAAMGKTSRETAELLNIKTYTVEQHRKEIKKKFNCKSLVEAVFTGMRFGYLMNKEVFGRAQ